MKAMVMNANKNERDMLCENLAKKGFSISVSEGGLEMLEDMSGFKSDIVVLDYETWRHNRAVYKYFGVEKIWSGIPVVLVGAKDKNAEVFTERNSHENDAVLDNPLNLENLDAVLEKITNN